MKHRSPLVTLAAVAVAFAIMFIVNMVVGPPGNSSTGTAGPSAAQATAPPARHLSRPRPQSRLPLPQAKASRTASSRRKSCTPVVSGTARP